MAKEYNRSVANAMKDYVNRTSSKKEDSASAKKEEKKPKEYDRSVANAMKDYATRTSTKKKEPTDKEKVASKPGTVVGSVKNSPTKTNPKKYGEGDEKVKGSASGKDKANVSAAQLKSSGLSLRQYMNQWNKTGSRPSGKK